MPRDPVSAYLDAITAAAEESRAIALVHATAHYDDRQVMEFLGRELQRRGVQAIPVSPNHLRSESGFAKIKSSFASVEPALLIRFFPAEWLPNLRPASTWKFWFCGGKTPMSNPGSAILIQSKRFPLAWPELKTALPTWQALLPETECPSTVDIDSQEWVLKPVFGRVGEDVAIANVTEPRAYQEILKDARRHPMNWVAQKRFASVPIETHFGNRYPCLGVFTVNEKAVGIYGRIASKPLIDHEAQDIAILVQSKGAVVR